MKITIMMTWSFRRCGRVSYTVTLIGSWSDPIIQCLKSRQRIRVAGSSPRRPLCTRNRYDWWINQSISDLTRCVTFSFQLLIYYDCNYAHLGSTVIASYRHSDLQCQLSVQVPRVIVNGVSIGFENFNTFGPWIDTGSEAVGHTWAGHPKGSITHFGLSCWHEYVGDCTCSQFTVTLASC